MLPGLPFLFFYELVRKVLQSQNIIKPLVLIAVVGNLVNIGAWRITRLWGLTASLITVAVEVWSFEILATPAGNLPESVLALSTHAVLTNVNVTLYTAFYGIAVAASIRVGNCLGAEQPKKAKMACYFDYTPRLFLDDDESIDLASKIMAMWSPLDIATGLNAVIHVQGVYRGSGKQKPAAIANVIGYYGGGISLGAIAADVGVEARRCTAQ
ncbi:multidrug/Oligosaccharidyl-lipid/Polysaccharide (MOP) Flippase superfamily [Phytophthora infestans T30-4]|uniref:Multidrug/Oligosaccharidyl-lipid/Polysaccharide (MOP) Flippase superfamily n=1 Tax=Phytophthora infestans (strain T30-4) TaxID=403677 RepID=D0NQF2_PHYIT|nr:multidrug/Oligosaccharidyl-lipid/Polysaccharide (MOP) Flippase superfamily [Phytophthora infestans T30-4]EEY62884.1 multidrug/Oligosaccharidyl-lipid/Polysaccharide (MOP) Flippase superfamily [Phytophthora infestans T30-4]|eukprot:XP_002898759.1 multidrug/Oligosaccharidyl-lipid/Polysaccharide (MOP) Flippase superfamily [Phytophthora infestans T30-4]